MALFNSMLGYDQQPQQNQYLTDNPSTKPNANTLWMDQSQRSDNTGINGGMANPGNISQQQPTPPSQVPNGTMLGSIAAGNVGQYMPGGYDQAKFNDPSLGTSTKYQVGRILSKYPPGPDGLQAASQELSALGISVIGKDKIKLPDGTTVDVGFSFSDPNAKHNWQYEWSGPLGSQQGSMPGNSMLGIGGNSQMNQNNQMNQIWQQLQARRNSFANQQFNPSGGSYGYDRSIENPWGYGGNTGFAGGVDRGLPVQTQPQFNMPNMMQPPTSFLGGGVIDPVTGQRRNPRGNEPQ